MQRHAGGHGKRRGGRAVASRDSNGALLHLLIISLEGQQQQQQGGGAGATPRQPQANVIISFNNKRVSQAERESDRLRGRG